MKKTLKLTRKNIIIICAIFVFLLSGVYLYALTRPGVWHDDTFMYLKEDGSFVGDDAYFDYHMTIEEKESGTAINVI